MLNFMHVFKVLFAYQILKGFVGITNFSFREVIKIIGMISAIMCWYTVPLMNRSGNDRAIINNTVFYPVDFYRKNIFCRYGLFQRTN